jgi:hypothetical protein
MKNSTNQPPSGGTKDNWAMQKATKRDGPAFEMHMDFGDDFAYKGADAHGGKSGKGENNGQESQEGVEEVEEAPADEAAV